MKKLLVSLLLGLMVSACNSPETSAEHIHPEGIHDHDRCHMCGMMITKYPGPKGEIALKNAEASPKFCSTRDMFNFALQPENQRQIAGMFVHDIGSTDWQTPNDEHLINATSAWYVYGTSRKAVMGSAVASFATKEAATEFAQEYGGAVLKFDQITLELLSSH
ncbi:nitrous oxide reductase accessory protein NosL [Shewanella maritima]|uniref:nitrous oxide reductase accessory protein NosL n=1 Tax=Shewanella maritima TaxID=2520507 RepID=UPI003735D439